jgi:O-antigen/teichoic acid export membrane protein
VPFLFLLAWGPDLFSLVFGEQWRAAGRLTQILAPGLLLEFIAVPLAVFFLVTGTQRRLFRVQLAGVSLLALALAAGRWFFGNFTATIVMISVAMVLANAWTIVQAAHVSSRSASTLPSVGTAIPREA